MHFTFQIKKTNARNGIRFSKEYRWIKTRLCQSTLATYKNKISTLCAFLVTGENCAVCILQYIFLQICSLRFCIVFMRMMGIGNFTLIILEFYEPGRLAPLSKKCGYLHWNSNKVFMAYVFGINHMRYPVLIGSFQECVRLMLSFNWQLKC